MNPHDFTHRYQRTAVTMAWLSALAMVLLFAAGCRSVNVRVTAFQSRTTPFPEPGGGNTVCVIADTEPRDPLFEAEVAAKVEHLLVERGYRTAPEERAKYLVFCFFGMDDGRTYTGTRSVYEPGDVVTSYYYTRRGRARAVRRTYYPGRTHYVPYTYTLFTKHLTLELTDRAALEAASREGAEPGEMRKAVIWNSHAINVGGGSDLRWLINHLLVASFDYLGQDTGRQERLSIRDGDDRVEALAGTVR